MSINFTDNTTIINAVGATTTSDAIDCSKRQLITCQFTTAGGTSVFTVDRSNDGTNWVTGTAFLDSKATAVGTYVVSKSVASTTEAAIIPAGFRYIRVKATWTSGTATAVLQMAG